MWRASRLAHGSAVLILCFAPQTGSCQSVMNFGNNVSAALCGIETDSLTFSAKAGDRVYLSLMACLDYGYSSCNNYRGACNFDYFFRLEDPSGRLVEESATGVNNNWCAIDTRLVLKPTPLPESGEYKVYMHDVNFYGGGMYSVFLQRTNAPEMYEVLEFGDNWPDRLTACGQVRTYVFQAEAAQHVEFSVTTESSVDPIMNVFDPTGRAIFIDERGTLSFEPELTGRYTVLVYSAGRATGAYRVALADHPTSVVAAPWGIVKRLYR